MVTGAPPAATCALRVTGVCQATDDEESVSVVVVGSGAACAAVATAQAAVSNNLEIRRPQDTILLQADEDTFHI